jgi:hypothetical protein
MKVFVITGFGKREEVEVGGMGLEVEIMGKRYIVNEANLPGSTVTGLSVVDGTQSGGSLVVYPIAENSIRIR